MTKYLLEMNGIIQCNLSVCFDFFCCSLLQLMKALSAQEDLVGVKVLSFRYINF